MLWRIILRLTCFFNGHGEFKEYWKTLDVGVQTSTLQCELCGKESP